MSKKTLSLLEALKCTPDWFTDEQSGVWRGAHEPR